MRHSVRGTSAERRALSPGLEVRPRLVSRHAREPTTMEMRERFSALFEHLAKEEETLKNVMSQNDIVERQLHDLRHSCNLRLWTCGQLFLFLFGDASFLIQFFYVEA